LGWEVSFRYLLDVREEKAVREGGSRFG
jgi:hypothetical protein